MERTFSATARMSRRWRSEKTLPQGFEGLLMRMTLVLQERSRRARASRQVVFAGAMQRQSAYLSAWFSRGCGCEALRRKLSPHEKKRGLTGVAQSRHSLLVDLGLHVCQVRLPSALGQEPVVLREDALGVCEGGIEREARAGQEDVVARIQEHRDGQVEGAAAAARDHDILGREEYMWGTRS